MEDYNGEVFEKCHELALVYDRIEKLREMLEPVIFWMWNWVETRNIPVLNVMGVGWCCVEMHFVHNAKRIRDESMDFHENQFKIR